MENFRNLYSLSKTLRFELRPYGETLEKIKESGNLERDQYKAEIRVEVQKIIDERYKLIIEETLNRVSLDEDLINKVLSEDKKIKDDAIKNLKDEITKCFSKDLFKEGKFIKNLVKENPNNDSLKIFENFTTYFTNFFDIRKYEFTGMDKGSISYRLINENLSIYLNNINKINKLPDDLKNQLKNLDEIIGISKYNNFLTQKGITKYNDIIGGISNEDSKIKGINEEINLYRQKNKVKLPKLDRLYKMILSDQLTSSFVIEVINSDVELIEILKTLIEKTKISRKLIKFDLEKVFIKYEHLGNLPKIPYSEIIASLNNKYDKEHSKKMHGKTYEENRKKFLKEDKYSIKNIIDLLGKNDVLLNMENYYKELVSNYEVAKDSFSNINWLDIKNIKQSKEKSVIKDLLDSLKAVQRFYNLFELVDEDKNPDVDFYSWLNENKKQVGLEFNGAYNKTRNYLTKKEYSDKKFKLNFDNSTLADGWDANKEVDNSTFIIRRFNSERNDYDYFVGIWNKSLPKKEKNIEVDSKGSFEKMKYKYYPDPSKMLPKQFMSGIWEKNYPTKEKFKEKYKKGLHRKGEKFDEDFLHELIDRFKHGLINHEEKYQDIFGFEFLPTKKYKTYSQFIGDVIKSSYEVSFEGIADISDLVRTGKLFLFQIWSKDFSTFSKGSKNLNTIYFESLFSEENLRDIVFKLSGKAELFYRPASIKYSKDKLERGHHHDELKDKFNYPIIKDRRYTKDKFFFHVPMEINFNSEKLRAKALNDRVNDNINEFTHIIGIDRGERHLIYLSVIEIATGKIVEQKHLDEIVNVDTKGNEHKSSYLKKLEEKASVRDDERKSWETIETIKELKEGYISQVVNEIRNLQEKYKALIVLENLNYGFKNSRIKVEKQIYQKFEVALIKKFNYVIDKNNPETYLKGIQLTNPITTLEKIGNQSGIVMYIPAWNTSKIDPVTGFVNLFYSNDLKYKNREETIRFIERIDRIYYEDNEFKFDIDFSKWNRRYEGSRRVWTLSSFGKRIYTFRNIDKNNNWDSKEIDLTKEFKKILNLDGSLKNDDVKSLKDFMWLFRLMVSLRNSVTGTEIDYMISPVADTNGNHFDTRDGVSGLPMDADGNGAYNIARKGIMVVNNIISGSKSPFKISNEDYLKYIQEK